jgi:uncharacterized integral membrane protein
MLKLLKLIILTALIVIFVSFAIENKTRVALELPFFPTSIETPLFLVIFFSLFFGMVISYSIYSFRLIKKVSEIHFQKKKIKALEEEIEILKINKAQLQAVQENS